MQIQSRIPSLPARIWTNSVWWSDCVGDESSILLCPGNPVGQELCDHGQDVGVICNMGKIENC